MDILPATRELTAENCLSSTVLTSPVYLGAMVQKAVRHQSNLAGFKASPRCHLWIAELKLNYEQ